MLKKIIIILCITIVSASVIFSILNKKDILSDDSVLNTSEDEINISNNIDTFKLSFFQSGKYGFSAHELSINNLEVNYFRDYPIYSKIDKKFYITEEEKNKIINLIQDDNFFKLKDNYTENKCMDGTTEKWKINLNNKNKKINLYFCDYPEKAKDLEKIKNEILSILDKYLILN